MPHLRQIHGKTRQAYNLAAETYHQRFADELRTKAYDRDLLDAFAGRFPPGSSICDAGCGPSGHLGRYLFDKGLNVVGVDISDRCVALARSLHPGMHFRREDMAGMRFPGDSFDGILAYYSIIHAPKRFASRYFTEFRRVLKPGGSLLVAVKAGDTEGMAGDLLGIETEIYFALFTEAEIAGLFTGAGFAVDFLERRNPYDFEIRNERIFAMGRKT
ncbi:MAG: methyltransferase domain-containing protein [Acidobacteria bacterium]|nr:methyltransferase domain-containing protein [Acidobacteriota bacterium]